MRLTSGTLCSTCLPWLPVLSNIEPPALRRKAATDKLLEKIVKRNNWLIQPDILNPPLLRLTRKLLWLDLQPANFKSRWRHNWKSAQVVNSHLVCNPTIRQLHVDSGDLNQAPPKQSAVCSNCIISAPPVNCQFFWMASAFGMSATQPILGWLWTVRCLTENTWGRLQASWRTETTCWWS